MSADGASRKTCLQESVLDQLRLTEPPAACALRLTVVANMFALPSGEEFILSDPTRLALVRDSALFHLHATEATVEIKQMAVACLHNLALALKSTFSVELLVGCLDKLSQEADGVVLERRAITAAIILRKFPQAKDSTKAAGYRHSTHSKLSPFCNPLSLDRLDIVIAATLVQYFKRDDSRVETKRALRELNRVLS